MGGPRSRKRSVSIQARALPQWPIGLVLLLVTAVFGIGNSSNAFLILQTKATGASLTTTILIYAAFNLVAALISYPAGALSDRFGRRNVLLVSFALFLATYPRLCAHAQPGPHRRPVRPLWPLPGDIPVSRQGACERPGPDDLRAGGVGWYGTIVD